MILSAVISRVLFSTSFKYAAIAACTKEMITLSLVSSCHNQLLSVTNTYIFHLLEVILEFFILFRLLRAILVDLLEPLADIFFVLLAALVEVDTRFIIGDPALAEVAELAALGLPIIRPAIRYHNRGDIV